MISRSFLFRSSPPVARAVLVTVLLTVLAHATQAQEIQPEDVGFAPFTVETDTNTVDVYVSSGGAPADTTTNAPLVVFLEGSGYGPVFAGPSDSAFHALFVRPEELPGHHYAVIGKPAAPFWMADNVQREPGTWPRAYHEALTRERRVADASAAIDFLVRQPWVDSSRVVVIGHSEGAQVAPALAASNDHVTHVAALGGNVLSQAYDFVLDVRRRIRAGELSFEEGEAMIAGLHDRFRRIVASPSAADSLWMGHSHRRWSTFFEPPLRAFLQLEVPVFVGVSMYDRAAPIEGADYLPVAFILAGKENLTYRAWPTDHGFQEIRPSGERVDRRPAVVDTLLEWLGT